MKQIIFKIDKKNSFTITLSGKKANITSTLHYDEPSEIEDHFEDGEWKKYESQINALENLILNHFLTGIDVSSKKYIEGLKKTINYVKIP